MKKIILAALASIFLSACINLDYYRSDTMTTAKLASDPGSAVYTTDGLYSMLKDVLMYRGSENSNNVYMRHLFQMTEFRGDNICLSGATSDPLYDATALTDNASTLNTGYFWYVSYKIIYGANSNIQGIVEGTSDLGDYLKGENYFIRAFMHLNLAIFFGKPYMVDKNAPGAVIRNSTDCSTTVRATVGEVYDQVVADLLEADRLMSKGNVSRGDNGYVTAAAAKALLSRVYLQMGEWDKCIAVCDALLGADPTAKLMSTAELPNFYSTTKTAKESIWCIDVSEEDIPTKKGTLASMYYAADAIGGTGWCEIYYSDPLLELYNRYPTDVRYTAFCELMDRKDGYMVTWPIASGSNNFRANALVISGVTKSGDNYTFSYEGNTYTTTAQDKDGNTYPEYYINYEGAETKVYVHPETVNSVALGTRQTYPAYMMKKFSYQDGDPSVASPCILRYGEVVLNRAEAYAHKADVAKALADVNIMRTRAGLSGEALMTAANYATRFPGSDALLDCVLSERRLELCFEGFRALDLIRNKKDIDRQFGGVQPYEVVSYNDDRLQYTIPTDETLVSGVK